MSIRSRELERPAIEEQAEDVLIFSYGSTPRDQGLALATARSLPRGLRRVASSSDASSGLESEDVSSHSDSSTSSAYSSESEWDSPKQGSEQAPRAPAASAGPSARSRPEPESRRALRQQRRLALFMETTAGRSGDVVRRLSPRSAQEGGTFALFRHGAGGPVTPRSGNRRTLLTSASMSSLTSDPVNREVSAQSTEQSREHRAVKSECLSRKERVRPPPIETRFGNRSKSSMGQLATNVLSLHPLTLDEPTARTLDSEQVQPRTNAVLGQSPSLPSSGSESGSTSTDLWTPSGIRAHAATYPGSADRWLASQWGPGEVLVPVIHQVSGDDNQHAAAVVVAYPRLPTIPMLAGSWSVSSSSSSTVSPRGAMSPSPRRAEAHGLLSSRRWWLATSSPGVLFSQRYGAGSRGGHRGETLRLSWSHTPRAAVATSMGALVSPMPLSEQIELVSERLQENLRLVLSADDVLRDDGSEEHKRSLFLLLSEGSISPANVYVHLRTQKELVERIRHAEGAAYRAILLMLQLLLEGPLEALAEATANGMLAYWQALYRHWSERLPNVDSMSELDAAQHWRTTFLVELMDYLTRKLRFHESYTAFESNYSLGRFFRRVDLEAIDTSRASENQQTLQHLFCLDTVTEMVSILHRLLDAELGLARHAGRLVAGNATDGSVEAPELRAVSGLYRERTLLRSLLSMVASDAANLYQMIIYMMSRMYGQLGKRAEQTNTRHAEAAELRELAVVLQEMGIYLRKFFERLLEADLVEQVPHIPPQLLIPAPDASMVASRFPFLVLCRFTSFTCLHRALGPSLALEAVERLKF